MGASCARAWATSSSCTTGAAAGSSTPRWRGTTTCTSISRRRWLRSLKPSSAAYRRRALHKSKTAATAAAAC
uniref:Putative secreted protein n=1 Tax=Ixodes ricinus TaxID=34613 RepID=A0A6B0TS91_IXORI